MTRILYIDGGCLGNEQKDITKRNMVSVVTDSDGKVISEVKKAGGSNNIAEFAALRDALKYAIAQGFNSVKIIMDSRNNLAWFYGRKIGKKANDYIQTKAIKDEIEALKPRIQIDLEWKDRKENKAGHYIEGKYSL